MQSLSKKRALRRFWKTATPKQIEEHRKKERLRCQRYRAKTETSKQRRKRLDRHNERNAFYHKHETRKQKKDRVERARRYRYRVRIKVIRHYGGKCSCCGESNLGFLTIGHKLNNGKSDKRFFAKHGRFRRAGFSMYLKIIKLGYPKDLTVLCWNCNTGADHNGGVCPHLRPFEAMAWMPPKVVDRRRYRRHDTKPFVRAARAVPVA